MTTHSADRVPARHTLVPRARLRVPPPMTNTALARARVCSWRLSACRASGDHSRLGGPLCVVRLEGVEQIGHLLRRQLELEAVRVGRVVHDVLEVALGQRQKVEDRLEADLRRERRGVRT